MLFRSGDSVIRVIEVASGQDRSPPVKLAGHLSHVEFSPDSETIVAVQHRDPAQVSFWNASTGTLRQQPVILGTGSTEAEFAAISPSGRRFVTTTNANTLELQMRGYHHTGTARVWDLSTNKPLTLPLPHRRTVSRAAFSPDDRFVATATGSYLDGSGVYEAWVCDSRTGLAIFPPLLHSAAISVVQFSPSGEALLTGSLDGTVRVWSIATGEPLTPPLRHPFVIRDASFSPDGSQILVASGETFGDAGEVRIWQWDASTNPKSIDTQTSRLQFRPDGRKAAAFPGATVYSDGRSNRAHLITLGDTSERIPLPHAGHAYSCSFSSDNRLVATSSGTSLRLGPSGPEPPDIGGEAWVWNAETGEPVSGPMKHPRPIVFTEISPDGQRLLTLMTDQAPVFASSFWLWDVNTKEPLISDLRFESPIVDARFSPDGKRIVVLGMLGATVVDVETNSVQTTKIQFRGGGMGNFGPQRRIAFAPSGSRAILCSGSDEALFLDVYSLEQVEPRITGQQINHVAFSSDGETVLTAGSKEVRLWNSRTGQDVTPPLTHEADVEFADFAFAGRIVLTASQDHTVRLWDSRTGEKVTSPFLHSSRVQQAIVSATGNRLYSQSFSKIVSWDLSPLTWPAQDLVSWMELVSCRRINDQGHLVTSNAKQRIGHDDQLVPATNATNPLWNRLREQHPAIFDQIGERNSPQDVREANTPTASPEVADKLELEGREAFERGQISDALTRFQMLNAVCIQLLQNDPQDRSVRRRLWVSHFWLGKTHIVLNRVSQAERNLLKAIELCKELIEDERSDSSAGFDLALPYFALSELKRSIGELNAARNHLEIVLKTLEPWLATDMEGKVYEFYLQTLDRLRDLCIEQGDMEGARAKKLDAIRLHESRTKEVSNDPILLSRLVNEHLDFALEEWHFGKTGDAQAHFQKAMNWFPQYRELDLQNIKDLHRIVLDVRRLGLLAIDISGKSAAMDTLSKGIDLIKVAVEKAQSPDLQYNFACLCALRASVASDDEKLPLTNSAITELQKAVNLGYRDYGNIERDEDLKAIRAHAGFQEILEQTRK